MLLASLMLAAFGHCADAAYCPPMDVIENAVLQLDVDEAAQRTADANPPGHHAITIYHPTRFYRLSDVYCDMPLGASLAVTCMATAHYGKVRAVHLFRLVQTPEGWKLATGGLQVFQR